MDARRFTHYRLPPTECSTSRLRNVELMPQCRQFLPNLFRHQRFDVHIASLETSFREAAGFHRFLNVESVIRNVRHELGVRLRLIESTHDAEADTHTVLFHERRNDRVQRPLAWRERVGMLVFEGE